MSGDEYPYYHRKKGFMIPGNSPEIFVIPGNSRSPGMKKIRENCHRYNLFIAFKICCEKNINASILSVLIVSNYCGMLYNCLESSGKTMAQLSPLLFCYLWYIDLQKYVLVP